MIKTLIALWKIASWLRSEKRKMEADIDGYLTQERALEWRLQLEKIFYALDTGSLFIGKLQGVPRPVQWFFSQTTIDNKLGEFGMWLLKSKKIEEDDKALNQPLYRHV